MKKGWVEPNRYDGITLDGFRTGFVSKFVSIIVIVIFSSVFYINPAVAAVTNELTKDDKREAELELLLEATPEQKLGHRLEKLKNQIQIAIPQSITERQENRNWLQRALAATFGDELIIADELTELNTLAKNIDAAYQEAISDFENEVVRLQESAVDSGREISPELLKVIKARHSEALGHVKSRYSVTQEKLTALTSARDSGAQKKALDDLTEALGQEKFKPTHTPATPNQLPWSAPDESVREPIESGSDLQAKLEVDSYGQYAQLAQAGELDPDLIAQAMANAANAELKSALTENIEIQLTPEIKALAAQLNNSSVEIYTWVHNNIRYIPSHGSIQGAQHTLETKQGNAIDTASLLIALLRAADIPARYVYGTVEIPAEKVMNWVGGAATPEAAQAILGIGGVPVKGVLEGGRITKFKLEHVWVEAYVDYFPSRGLVEKVGDSWVPMDASFKQYDFTEGMNLKDEVPFDAESLVSVIQTKATINEEEGWVQNVPQSDIEAQLESFQAQLKSYIENQNPDSTVGEVLGLQEIKILPHRPLAAGLPYNRIVTSQTFNVVPDKLRHKFKYSLALQYNGYPEDPFISITEPTAKIAGKSIALSFKPATKTDEDIIVAQIPSVEEDGSIDPAKLPKTLPGYLINLQAELTVNGEVIKSGGAGKMGSELHEEMGLWSPKDGWETSLNNPIAGSYRAIGLNLQGVNPEQAARLKSQLEATKAALESNDDIQLASLTKHDLVGDLLYGTVFTYFAMNDLQDQIAAQSSNIITYRLPSYGTFSTKLTPQYWYGLPRNVSFGGLTMDIDRIKLHRVSKTNNNDEVLAFSHASGARMSAMEHLVPEQMFSTETDKAQGISAVKAIAIAGQQGQKIWTIDKNNLDLALSKINLGADAESDIRNAVNAGRVATAHESRINFNGWIGEGYILMDPKSGAGAYMISGGGNGSETVIKAADMLNWISFAAGLKLAMYIAPWAAPLGLLLAGVNIFTTLLSLSLSCPGVFDTVALLSIWFFSIAFLAMGMFFTMLGPLGVLAAIMMSILMQGLSTYVGRSVKDAC